MGDQDRLNGQPAGEADWLMGRERPQQHMPPAVSYTHLDVYKRQMVDQIEPLGQGDLHREFERIKACLLYTSRCV